MTDQTKETLAPLLLLGIDSFARQLISRVAENLLEATR
jgi:hypothetical protein